MIKGDNHRRDSTSESDVRAIQEGITNSTDLLLSIHAFKGIDVHYGGGTSPTKLKCKATTTTAYIRFKSYAPVLFYILRQYSNITEEEFMESLCSLPLKELDNPGASGSNFYVSSNDKFIIKTVQRKESKFLRSLLPEYLEHLRAHPNSLLPKFYGFFSCETREKKRRLLVMKNLLPCTASLQKYDLKGSVHNRFASKRELKRAVPTLKDLDFAHNYPAGITLSADVFHNLMANIREDCKVLERWGIMDYSLLLGVASTRINHPGGYEGKDADGMPLHLFFGIIDILQSYNAARKIEHTFKGLIHGFDRISIARPDKYSRRFQALLGEEVFHPSS